MLDLSRLADAIRYEGGVSRRLFLAYGSALATLPLLASRTEAADRTKFDADPFSLGVASGDPDASSVLLWTRLAPKPAEPEGGMKAEAVKVTWEIAEDEAFTRGVTKGDAIASPALGHSVHVEARGLKPDRWYFFRFRAGDATSPIGRTRTLPDAESTPDKLTFAFASCQHFEQGYYTAYSQMLKDTPDLVFHLGDYIYEYPHNPKAKAKLVRKHTGPKDRKIKTLNDYRERHAQYRSDPYLNKMHAACPWFVTWDDHEFDNNYANDIQEKQPKNAPRTAPADFLLQRAAAYQAYYEFMPLRKRSLPRGADMTLYRKASFGRLAEFFVLDTRQYRTPQPNGDGMKPLNAEALKNTNTILGRKQKGWLQASLLESTGTWNVLAQQVMMAMVGFPIKGDKDEAGDEPKFAMDQWPGYAYERIELMRWLAERKISNPVVLTGDIHTNWANDLRIDDRKSDSPVVATEFVCTSISSGGNASWVTPEAQKVISSKNPGVRFVNGERGYVRCVVTPKTWQSDYVVCEDVLQAAGKIATRASFVVEAGQAGVKKA
jgi:alkaline phosphatase D